MKKRMAFVLALLLLCSVIGTSSATKVAAANISDSAGVQWLPRISQLETAVSTAVPTAEATAEATKTAPPTAAQLENFYHQIWQLVGGTYYNPDALKDWGRWEHKFDGKLLTIDDLETAMQQMVASIGDHWTSYTPRPELIKQYNQYQAGAVDLGMMLKLINGAYRVWYVEWGSAAWSADIRRGDIITSVAGTNITNKLSQEEVDALLQQQQGTKVVVVDQHGGVTENIEITAAAAITPKVESQLYANGLAYIRFPNFDDPALLQDFVDQLGKMYDASGPRHFKALVIDLRGNPGGLVSEAVTFVSAFLQKGVVMNETTRDGRIMTTSQLTVAAPQIADGQLSNFAKYIEEVPLYLLVDENSASAAEITTGAFKDNNRAVIIGNTTWGKGVGYVTYDQQSGPYQVLPTGGILQITTLGLRTPSGANVQGRGVRPNVFIYQPRGHTSDVQLQKALNYINGAMQGQ